MKTGFSFAGFGVNLTFTPENEHDRAFLKIVKQRLQKEGKEEIYFQEGRYPGVEHSWLSIKLEA